MTREEEQQPLKGLSVPPMPGEAAVYTEEVLMVLPIGLEEVGMKDRHPRSKRDRNIGIGSHRQLPEKHC